LTGVVVVSDWTDPEGVAFSPPGLAGWSAVGLGSFPGGVGALGSSGICREGKPSAQSAFRRTITFISLSGWCQRGQAASFYSVFPARATRSDCACIFHCHPEGSDFVRVFSQM
jgi:hypothetical protein